MLLDAEYHDSQAVRSDFFAIDYVRDRVRPGISERTTTRLDTQLEALLDAINEDDMTAVTTTAQRLRTALAGVSAG
jgi:hypothetical protein